MYQEGLFLFLVMRNVRLESYLFLFIPGENIFNDFILYMLIYRVEYRMLYPLSLFLFSLHPFHCGFVYSRPLTKCVTPCVCASACSSFDHMSALRGLFSYLVSPLLTDQHVCSFVQSLGQFIPHSVSSY